MSRIHVKEKIKLSVLICSSSDLFKHGFIKQLSVQLLSHVRLFVTPCTAACWASCPSATPGAYSSSCPSSRWCHLTISSSLVPFSSCLQSFSASGSSNESILCIRWPKYWSFSFSISPSNECSKLISFRIDWFDLLAVQGTLKSLIKQHSSKASILWHSAFFSPILTSVHDYWKNHSFD